MTCVILRTDVTGWDSNYGENTQMILKKFNERLLAMLIKGGEGGEI